MKIIASGATRRGGWGEDRSFRDIPMLFALCREPLPAMSERDRKGTGESKRAYVPASLHASLSYSIPRSDTAIDTYPGYKPSLFRSLHTLSSRSTLFPLVFATNCSHSPRNDRSANRTPFPFPTLFLNALVPRTDAYARLQMSQPGRS